VSSCCFAPDGLAANFCWAAISGHPRKGQKVTKRDDALPLPAQIARANRLRRAAEEAAEATKDATNRAIAIRENMARLRELRLAREAAAVRERNAEASINVNSKRRRKPK
jgi:hypothetical protein